MTRLIDADALKEAIETYDKFACLPDCKLEPFRNLEHTEMFEPYVHLRDILNAIDKAPIVEVTEEKMKLAEELAHEIVDDLEFAYNNGYKQGQEDARIQGEWISGFKYALDKAFSEFDSNCTYSGDRVLQKLEKLKEGDRQ